MATARFGRLQRATAIVPLAVLSAAWTASLTTSGGTAAASADPGATLPDGSTVPSRAIEAPASVSAPGSLAPGIKGDPSGALRGASANGIPAAALAAYQRAETVINAADRSCHLPWQLVAAIGRVESDHGRVNGNHLDGKGFAVPGIYGLPLDGTHGTSVVRDTDAGLYDKDSTYDRAVGPMQFIPSTWSVVGVDADNDTRRDPQDINDAALASAVYLCSGTDDLSTDAGQRSSVFRYNHSQQYVDLVLAFMHAYMNGDFTSVPNDTTTAGYLTPLGPPPGPHLHGGQHRHPGQGHHHQVPGPGAGPSQPPSTTTPTSHSPAPQAPASSAPASPHPTHLPTKPPTIIDPSDVPTLPSAPVSPVQQVLTKAQAVATCLAEGYVDNPLDSNDPFDKCVYDYTH